MLSLKYRLTTRNAIWAVAMIIVVSIMVSIAHTQEILKSVDSLIVVDANGKKVGNVIGLSGPPGARPVVSFELDKLLFVLDVFPSRFGSGTETNYLYFESNDCTGTPYFQVDGIFTGTPIPIVAVNLPGNTVYIPDPNTDLQEKLLNSFQPDPESICNPAQIGVPKPAIKAVPTIDLAQFFTPPFKVQAGPKDNGPGHDKGKGKDK